MNELNVTPNTPEAQAGYREVSKDEFFRAMNQNVHPQPVGPWPYTSLFKTPHGDVRGKIVDYMPENSGLPESRYYVAVAA